MAHGPKDNADLLTPRESEVLDLIREGLTDDQIAVRLDVSPTGARYYATEVMTKLGVSTREEAARWIPPSPPGLVSSLALSLSLRRLRRLRITPLRAIALFVVLAIAGFYAYSLFIYEKKPADNSQAVAWLQVDPPLGDVREQQHPFAGAVLSGEDVWRAYVVEGAGPPRRVLETSRMLSGPPVWSAEDSEIVFPFLSQTASGSGSQSSAGIVTGYVAIDRVTARTLWERAFSGGASARLSPAGDLLALTVSTPVGGRTDVYVIDPDGTSIRLSTTRGQTSNPIWSPDGKRLLVSVIESGTTSVNRFSFVVSPGEGGVIETGRLGQFAAWSPDGRRIAGVQGEELVIFDVESRGESRLNLGPRSGGNPAWSLDGRTVTYNGAIVAAETGRELPAPGLRTTAASLSPDGKWFAIGSDSTACARPSSADTRSTPTQNQTRLKEVATGRETLVLNCAEGFFTYQRWLSPGFLLLGGSACANPCLRPTTSVLLVTLPGARFQPLTSGPEEGAALAVSPDNQKVLVSGSELRLFSADGAPQRRIQPPEGFIVTAVSWSNDGSAFAYVTAPRLTSQAPGTRPAGGVP